MTRQRWFLAVAVVLLVGLHLLFHPVSHFRGGAEWKFQLAVLTSEVIPGGLICWLCLRRLLARPPSLLAQIVLYLFLSIVGLLMWQLLWGCGLAVIVAGFGLAYVTLLRAGRPAVAEKLDAVLLIWSLLLAMCIWLIRQNFGTGGEHIFGSYTYLSNTSRPGMIWVLVTLPWLVSLTVVSPFLRRSLLAGGALSLWAALFSYFEPAQFLTLLQRVQAGPSLLFFLSLVVTWATVGVWWLWVPPKDRREGFRGGFLAGTLPLITLTVPFLGSITLNDFYRTVILSSPQRIYTGYEFSRHFVNEIMFSPAIGWALVFLACLLGWLRGRKPAPERVGRSLSTTLAATLFMGAMVIIPDVFMLNTYEKSLVPQSRKLALVDWLPPSELYTSFIFFPVAATFLGTFIYTRRLWASTTPEPLSPSLWLGFFQFLAAGCVVLIERNHFGMAAAIVYCLCGIMLWTAALYGVRQRGLYRVKNGRVEVRERLHLVLLMVLLIFVFFPIVSSMVWVPEIPLFEKFADRLLEITAAPVPLDTFLLVPDLNFLNGWPLLLYIFSWGFIFISVWAVIYSGISYLFTKSKIMVVVVLCLMVGGLFAIFMLFGYSISHHFKEGNDAYDKSDYKKAIVEYNAVIKLNSSDEKAYYNRGLSYHELGDNNDALADFSKAIQLNSADPDTYNQRAAIYYGNDEYGKAIADYTQFLRLGPKNEHALYRRGNSYVRIGEYDKARADYDQAILLDPKDAYLSNSTAWFLATCPDARFRDGAKALGYALRACQLTGDKEGYMFDTVAAAYAETGNFDQAVQWENKFLAAPGQSAEDIADGKKRLILYQARQPYHGG